MLRTIRCSIQPRERRLRVQHGSSRFAKSMIYQLGTGLFRAMRTNLHILRDLHPHIAHILRFQHLDQIHRKRFVPPIRRRHATFRLPLDHAPVELILVSERRLFAELADPVLLRLVVARSVDIVLVLLEEAEALSVEGLGALLVIPPSESVWKSASDRRGHAYSSVMS